MISLELPLRSDPSYSRIYYNHQILCTTLSGHPCPLITVTNIPMRGKRMENKEYVVLSARVHPGESNSSWVMKGE